MRSFSSLAIAHAHASLDERRMRVEWGARQRDATHPRSSSNPPPPSILGRPGTLPPSPFHTALTAALQDATTTVRSSLQRCARSERRQPQPAVRTRERTECSFLDGIENGRLVMPLFQTSIGSVTTAWRHSFFIFGITRCSMSSFEGMPSLSQTLQPTC